MLLIYFYFLFAHYIKQIGVAENAVKYSDRAGEHDVRSECSGESDQVSAVEHVRDSNRDAALPLL